MPSRGKAKASWALTPKREARRAQAAIQPTNEQLRHTIDGLLKIIEDKDRIIEKVMLLSKAENGLHIARNRFDHNVTFFDGESLRLSVLSYSEDIRKTLMVLNKELEEMEEPYHAAERELIAAANARIDLSERELTAETIAQLKALAEQADPYLPRIVEALRQQQQAEQEAERAAAVEEAKRQAREAEIERKRKDSVTHDSERKRKQKEEARAELIAVGEKNRPEYMRDRRWEDLREHYRTINENDPNKQAMLSYIMDKSPAWLSGLFSDYTYIHERPS